MNDGHYYEQSAIWHPSRYADADQQGRFESTAALLPADLDSLLDVGCGNGAFLNHIERTRSIPRLRGIERAVAAVAASVCNSPVDNGSVDSLPYEDRSFDGVAALEVIEHLPEPYYERSLREIGRVAGRFVFISVPYCERRHNVSCPACSCAFHPSYHVRSFTESTMVDLMGGFALQDLRTLTVDDYLGGGFLRAAYRVIARGDDMPPGSLCPQCGYRQPPDRDVRPVLGARRALRGRLKQRLPKHARPNWFVGLYERTSS